MAQSDEELEENVLAAVKKLAGHVPGHWNNIQGLSLKLEKTQSIPLYVKMGQFLLFLQSLVCLVKLIGRGHYFCII